MTMSLNDAGRPTRLCRSQRRLEAGPLEMAVISERERSSMLYRQVRFGDRVRDYRRPVSNKISSTTRRTPTIPDGP